MKPIYKIGDILFYKKINRVFRVKDIKIYEYEGVLYQDEDGVYYEEAYLVPYLDFIKSVAEESDLFYYTGFPDGYNPEIVSIDNDTCKFSWEVPTSIFLEQCCEQAGSVLVKGMRRPQACIDCPIAAFTEDDQILCCQTGSTEDPVYCTGSRMKDCPLLYLRNMMEDQ